MFKMQFLPTVNREFDMDLMLQLLDLASDSKIVEVNHAQGLVTLANTKAAAKKLAFLKELLQNYVDTFYVVLSTANMLMELGVTIDQSKLTTELHQMIKDLYEQGLIRYLDSCHKETIESSFARIAQLGACKQHSFDIHTQSGKKAIYVSCSQDHGEAI